MSEIKTELHKILFDAVDNIGKHVLIELGPAAKEKMLKYFYDTLAPLVRSWAQSYASCSDRNWHLKADIADLEERIKELESTVNRIRNMSMSDEGKWVEVTAECDHILKPEKPIGIELDSICNRNGCKGVIVSKPVENCSCHINPPCSACVDAPLYCPECEWEEE